MPIRLKPVPFLRAHHLMILVLSFCCAGERVRSCDASDDPPKPNFVVFLMDDVGHADIGVQGAEGFETPSFDRMAREGTRLTSFYVHPVCGVTRAALLTGCYAMRVAEVGNEKHGHPVLHPEEITIAEMLKQAGYATALIGKWHLAGPGNRGEFRGELLPNAQGFDYWFGTPTHNGFSRTIEGSKFRAQLMRNGQTVDPEVDQKDMDQLTRQYTDEAVAWMRAHRDEPFFLYVAHNMAHVVLGASEDFRGTSQRGLYGDAMQELDWSLGQILATIRELGLDDRTLVIATSDNGPWVEEHLAGETPRDDHYGRATPLRGSKMMTWEGGVRVPCIARWPGKVPESRVTDEPVAVIDLLPTFATLAEVDLLADRIIDGRDLTPLLMGTNGDRPVHDALYSYAFTHLQAVRSGKWKLVLARPERPPWCSWSARMIDAVAEPELYDLSSDMGEQRNVAHDHPEQVAQMLKLVDQARADLGDYDRIGTGQRFFDEGPRRAESARWLPETDRHRGSDKKEENGRRFPRDFRYRVAIGPQSGVTRRDPSDVIRVGGTYYVWYSKVRRGPDVWGYPSGYSADVWYATSPNGIDWLEQGQALKKGGPGAWDEHGVFTPNIFVADGLYYLYYTGVARGHDATTPTRIGVAVSRSPDGPWKRWEGNPVLEPSEDPERFDSMRVDDAALVRRGDEVWLYYKGRQQGRSPGETKMGVAISRSPTGPFAKHGEPTALHPGHEVLIWSERGGVASMATAAGPRQIYFAADGIAFEPQNAVAHAPRAPGAFRPDLSDGDGGEQGLRWGISHTSHQGDLHLVRFDALHEPAVPVGNNQLKVEYDHPPPVGPLRFDFETGDLQGWRVVDGSFESLLTDRANFHHMLDQAPYNKQGKYFLSTLERRSGGRGNDSQTGIVESPEFTITGDAASFLIGGGGHPGTYVALVDATSGEELLTARGKNAEIMMRVQWDVGPYRGRRVKLRVVDRETKGWGHVTFDDFSCQGELH